MRNNRNNSNVGLEQSIRSIVRDELARSFQFTSQEDAGNVSFSEAPTQTSSRGRTGAGRGRVTNPKSDKRLKRNTRRSANA